MNDMTWAVGDPVILGFAVLFSCFAWGLTLFAIAVAWPPSVLNLFGKLAVVPIILGLMFFCLFMAVGQWAAYFGGLPF